MAKELTRFWTESMSTTGKSVSECFDYLQSFFKSRNMATMAAMLMKDLTQDLVAAALESH